MLLAKCVAKQAHKGEEAYRKCDRSDLPSYTYTGTYVTIYFKMQIILVICRDISHFSAYKQRMI